MFSKQDRILLIVSGALVTSGFLLMMFDNAPNGFGVATLWIAPPLLVTGFVLPVMAITGVRGLSRIRRSGNVLKDCCAVLSFLVPLIVYLVTLEPTASLWDCSEFIASAYKLQVPHTPGTPMSLIIGRLFTMLSFGDVFRVAWTLNFMSALFSALSVFVLFQLIFLLGKRFVIGDVSENRLLPVAALAGSLCLAFSDTFWFSAVEAETYGAACFFLLLLAWLTLSGRDLTGDPRSRRLILIFYLAGLSYCIHPMCLLALPMLPYAWAGQWAKVRLGRIVFLLGIGVLIVWAINRFVAIGYFELAFHFDRFFVNSLGLPFYTGAFFLVTVCVGVFMFALQRFPRISTYVWSVAFLLLGFLPYLLLFIRSNHNPPIDETNPENLAMIKAYMGRESYPTSPLLYGPYFDARIADVGVRGTAYYKGEDRYEVAGTLPEYIYKARQTLLPRLYSNDENHIATYRAWTGLREHEKPDFYDNLEFLFSYQLGHMYFRYLMWNFAGREGDEQNSGWLRPWKELSSTGFEKARNQYWMMPLLLGIIGAVVQYRRDRDSFVPVATFFLITGAVLALYLNAPPNEPRERDYIYVGSFIAFSVWIGLGVYTVVEKLRHNAFRVLGAFLICLLPAWMLWENFDDHDRSGRTFQVDHARNVLRSCAPHAILFTGGDNDTFPLWYVQEVEGFRTDVRVMVLSYMNTDWYINQLRKAYYDSPAFDLTLSKHDYRQYGANDVLYVQETITAAIDVMQYMKLLKEEHPALRMQAANGESYHVLPSRSLRIAPGRRTVVPAGSKDTIHAGDMMLTVSGNYVSKNMLAILDLMISNGWTRPIYFNFTSLNSLDVDLSPYVIQEGTLFRLRPERNTGDTIAVDTGESYHNLVETADYSNLSDGSVYFTYEDHFARMIVPLRHTFNDLAAAFLREGDQKMASDVLGHALETFYPDHLQPSFANLQAAEILLTLNETASAARLCNALFEVCMERVKAERSAGREPSDLDRYLLRRAAELLAVAGDDSHLEDLSRVKGKQ